MLTDFCIQTPDGRRLHFQPEFTLPGGRVRWLCVDLDNGAAPIEARVLPTTAARREVVAAFRN